MRQAVRLPLQAELRAAVTWEQLRMIWLHAEIALLLASGFAVLLSQRMQAAVPAGWALVWLCAKLGWAALRLVTGRRFSALAGPGDRMPAWERRTVLLLAVDGVLWGLAGATLVGGRVEVAALMAAVLACVSCVATFGLQSSFAATLAFVAPILLPCAVGLGLRGDDAGLLGGSGLLLLLIVQLSTAMQAQRRTADQVMLRLQAQELARQKDEALRLALQQSAIKSQFLGSVSHELRTPLHGILGLVRLMHLESVDPAGRQRMELVEASASHLLGLINDLLDLSRMDAGQFTLREDPCDLRQQIAQVVGLHEVRAQDKGLALRCELDLPDPCWVRADAARLRQVLHNLLGNAIKFTQTGSVVVRARAGNDLSPWVLEVEDTGVGIAASDLQRIFGAFEQAESARHNPTEGVGLGLKIAREIAVAMGGELTVRSEPGHGACFSFSARLLPVDAPPPGSVALGASAAPTRSPPGTDPVQALGVLPAAPPRVLLAEDDDVNALIASAYLRRAGAVVERVTNGKEAVRRALRETQRPDLLLMDCRMPVMDGYAATEEIRSQETALGFQRLPVVALTATVTELGHLQCQEAGMDDFLAKPFSADELERVLRRFCPAPGWR